MTCPAPRPCPYLQCRYHLLGGKRSKMCRHPPSCQETCALDAAERGPLTLDEVARLIGYTRERIRQIEVAALMKLEERLLSLGLSREDLQPYNPRSETHSLVRPPTH